ncbi:hypothetical protein Agabi119p4_1797 [Agaricus bisporus var. burnettii]|uniref:Uncharacterized protein n=1 Tax=Agaricus bisporus var. burnettii TaxID=192524 RepID=A0A8H7F7U1_AGABI|nr:hypothetical protein Agabi119p4_1797 [Agaricus bisporus var. burnettii]
MSLTWFNIQRVPRVSKPDYMEQEFPLALQISIYPGLSRYQASTEHSLYSLFSCPVQALSCGMDKDTQAFICFIFIGWNLDF